MSTCPFSSSSLSATWIGAASLPVLPKRTVFALTVVASKPLTLKIATLITLVLFGFTLLASFFGLISTTANTGPRNSTEPMSQMPARSARRNYGQEFLWKPGEPELRAASSILTRYSDLSSQFHACYGHSMCSAGHTPVCGSSDHQSEGSPCTGSPRIQ